MNETNEVKKELKINGVPLKLFLLASLLIAAAFFTGSLDTDMLSTMAFLFVLGSVCYAVGERIPIFNTWIGGGSMLAMLLPSILVYVGVIGEKYVESVTLFFDSAGFQNMFICVLMAGSFIALSRGLLIKSIVRYIPTILAGVAMAAVFGVVVGMVLGYTVPELMTYYVLPIMGGGNGAGAIPMSQIYEAATGNSKDTYYAVAVAILTIANIICIIAGAILNGIGKMVPKLTGDKKSIMRQGDSVKDEKIQLPKPTMEEMAGGILIIGAVYALSRLMASKLLPSIGGIRIHAYVYFVLFMVLLNISNIVPLEFRAGIKGLQAFLVGKLGVVAFAAVGVSMLDFGEFISAINVDNLIISLAVVLGAIVGTAVAGWFLGFYPIDAAVTAGLCMANRGGSGDVVVLSAADRLELMSYAAISSRVGGGLVLVIAGVVFNMLL
ncbi:MAG: 2-hydroxycarboxylate transporter family protein [Lachnospiraceae bacterium]|jgi:Na+/citrate or Na+/malate symporter|nr:2-hydroxycarboxylate transporter family protein [Lachnospiraceae bacterium]MCI8960939.1 2-hydroxycarboxylate transporter family protein [Lachnospiraceae bacterium]